MKNIYYYSHQGNKVIFVPINFIHTPGSNPLSKGYLYSVKNKSWYYLQGNYVIDNPNYKEVKIIDRPTIKEKRESIKSIFENGIL